LAGPLEADLVKWDVAALLPLVTGLKIIDFSGQSSFATASKHLANLAKSPKIHEIKE
jgi:hypothetical protein